MKVLSIAQLAMAAMFFTLGMVDRYKEGYIETSLMFTPCWISSLVRKLISVFFHEFIYLKVGPYKL